MGVFDERERGFEAGFKHDQELRFRITARRNRMLGLWAAKRMGLVDELAHAYATDIVDAEFNGGDRRVIEKVCADLNATGQICTSAQIELELTRLAKTAKQQCMRE